jgi:hypothetical protein
MSERDVDQALEQAQAPDGVEAAGYGFKAAGPCPVRPLGHRGGVYFYLSPRGELRTLAAREHNKLGIISLFEGDLEWCRIAAPAFDKDGAPRPGSWSPDAIASFLMRACGQEGLYDPTMPVRSLGVWKGRDGAPIVHCGSDLYVEGERQPAGVKLDGALYPAAARIAPPAAEPAGRDVGRKIAEGMRGLWSFEDPIGADLVMGWLGAAMLGAFPTWRAHIYVTAERGAGKTWLADLVSAALGAQAHAAMNNFTEAGLRQSLTGEARALVLDESEHDESSRVQAVIELLRHMSSGEGARAVRGSAGGSAQTFSVTGCAYLSSILHVPMKPQDRSRIAVVRLGQLTGGPESTDRAERARALIKWAKEHSDQLRARAIANAPFFVELGQRYRRAFLERGADARQADQLATLAAGRDLMTQDETPDDQALRAEVEAFDHVLEAAREDDASDGEGEQCLSQLYGYRMERWNGGEQRTLAETVMDAVAASTPRCAANDTLGRVGLKVRRNREGPGCHLLVATRNVGLSRIFEGTRWAQGGWTQALRYLPGAEAHAAVKFAGVASKATALPTDLLPSEDLE